jgi:hypothetical protein
MVGQLKQKEKMLHDIKDLCWWFVNRYISPSYTSKFYRDYDNEFFIYYNYDKKIYIYIDKLTFIFNLKGDVLDVAFDGKILAFHKALNIQGVDSEDYFDIETTIPDVDILFDYYKKLKTIIIRAI